MTIYRQLELPGMPAETPQEVHSGKSGKTTWWYITDGRNERMRGADSDLHIGRWMALDLQDSRILLFNSRQQAREVARRAKGKVKIYPYDLDLMRGHWQ